MVNLTVDSPSSSSSPTLSVHPSGLITPPANEDSCNDDPPPIPRPLAGNGPSPSVDPRHMPAGGTSRPDSQSPRNLTAGLQPKIYDYGAKLDPSHLQQQQQQQQQSRDNLSSTSTATSFRETSTGGPNSANSSFTAVEQSTDETTIDIPSDIYDGKNPHIVDAQDVAVALGVDFALGLKPAEAAARLELDGPNKLTSDGGITWYGVLLRQVSNSLTLVCDSTHFLLRLPRMEELSAFHSLSIGCIPSSPPPPPSPCIQAALFCQFCVTTVEDYWLASCLSVWTEGSFYLPRASPSPLPPSSCCTNFCFAERGPKIQTQSINLRLAQESVLSLIPMCLGKRPQCLPTR